MIGEKKRLRTELLKVRNSILEQTRHAESEKIANRLIETELYKNAESIFVYVSVGSEVETSGIIERIINDGKRVAVPLCDKDERIMTAVLIDSRDDLKTGAYGIPEPKNADRVLPKNEIDLIITPAIAFDRQGMRLGYGGGYYDKFLSGYEGISIGLAFSECIKDKLPSEEFDCRVDRVISPEEMI